MTLHFSQSRSPRRRHRSLIRRRRSTTGFKVQSTRMDTGEGAVDVLVLVDEMTGKVVTVLEAC